MEMKNNLKIDVKGPYRVDNMVIGSYKFIDGRIVKGDNLAGDSDLENIVAMFSFGMSYEGDECTTGGNLLLPTVPTLDSLNLKVQDLDKKEVKELYTNIISPFYTYNRLKSNDGIDNELLSLGNCLANFYNRHIKNTYKEQPSVVKFDALDIKGMFSNENKISTYYEKSYLDKVYEECRGELDTNSKFAIVVTRPILDNRVGNVHEINKMLITFYTPDTNPVALILSFKELTPSDMDKLNSTKIFAHDVK